MRDFVERYDRETADPKWLLTSNVPTVDREVGANVERSVLERQIAHELLHNDNRPERGPATLTPVLCDDWLIFARDRDGAPYMVVTEMWSEWLDCPQGADHQPNALLTHMLPVAWEKGYFHHPECSL